MWKRFFFPHLILAFFLTSLLFSCVPGKLARDGQTGSGNLLAPQAETKQKLRNSFGTYNAPPRQANGRVDTARLLAELEEIGANTYNFLVWQNRHDWEDLKLFLPLARQKQILVWVTIFPPSESVPYTKRYSEPFRLDFEKWAEEIARLSLTEPNLVAWSIDDFTVDLKFFTPEKMQGLTTIARNINGQLAFVPCCYYRQIITPAFVSRYLPLIDGILFPYLHASGKENLTDTDRVTFEVDTIREVTGDRVPIILDVYASPHTGMPPTTPAYVKTVMEEGRRSADGVHVYRHQDKKKEPEKYEIIKQLFQAWKGS